MDNLDRLLSIIFCADIVGYTSMMQKDEQIALSKLKHYEDAIYAETSKCDGEVIKTYGDGCLILFPSAVKAIHCAISIQRSLRDDPIVPLRIGIHIGEIVRKDHDIFGNGVNVASRIESMGVSNSVIISEDVFTQVKNHKEFIVQKLGAFEFKNVERDIDLYAITNDDLAIPVASEMKGKGKIKASASIFSWSKLKLVSLILIIMIGIAFAFKMFNSPSPSGAEMQTNDLKALDLYLKGELHSKKESLSNIDTAIVYYNKAIEANPNFANAYNGLASTYMRKYLSFEPDTKWEEEAYSAAGKALLIDPKLANPHIIRGQFYWSLSHNFAHEEAFNEFVKAIDNDPENSEAYEQLALVQLHIGLFDDALKNAEKSIELDPVNFRARRFIGEIFLFQGKYSLALKEFEKIPANFAPHPTLSLQALIHFYLDQPEEAIEILDQNLEDDPNNANLNSVYAIIHASKGNFQKAEQKMKISLDNSRDYIHAHHIYYHLGIASALINKKSEAVEWLTKATETGFPNYPLINLDPALNSLKGHPEYEALLIELKEKWEYFKTL